ncbi:MAG: hypothetical protein ACD_79C01302G0010 [uncultured bacterium]|nr:MAG: hypothetical protein ACD_79C01302G0010 [uncultured bacterium]
MNKVFIIAEAGVNHNGNLEQAIKLIDIAYEAKADAVKFQMFKAERLVTKTLDKVAYQINNMKSVETQYEMLKRLELKDDDYVKIKKYCDKKGIIFLCTPFDEFNADFLDAIGVEKFKIPSGEITNKPLIQHIAKKNKPIILSTGMSDLEEINQSISWINEVWRNFSAFPVLSLMHCVTAYPAQPEDINLKVIQTLKDKFNLSVGLSDHTSGIEISIAAVALGAELIEKHFTISRDLEGPDHKASVEPIELRQLVSSIRNVEIAMGNGIKCPVKDEEIIKTQVRKSIVSIKFIKKGEVITNENIFLKRPGTGISPEYFESVIGMKVKQDIEKDTVLKWDMLQNA